MTRIENLPKITLIAAMDRQGVIGADGGLPWKIPGDLRWFKEQTLDRTLLMGRRTFESIGRPLPRRCNLVMTRNADFAASGIETVESFDAAVQRTRQANEKELVVIGGAQIYALALPYADCLKITRIEASYEGDTYFPDLDWQAWRTVEEHSVAADFDTPAHRFVTLCRQHV